jgi:hypothetical protein
LTIFDDVKKKSQMKVFERHNNLTGWVVFGIATLVYWITVEPTASYWDCGEFIAVSYKLEVPHPPGAPFFLLVGRLFSFLAFGDVDKVAYWINMVSVLSSGFTILFLFWTITLFGRKLINVKEDVMTTGQSWLILGAGIVGSLAYTFSDSFWFSAVEAEVYAMSSFFTAFVVWAILKWERIEDEQLADRWLILIFYMMGLSIGVHLLNLVTIPALALIFYFKRYKPTTWGVISTLLIGVLIVVFINDFIIPGLPGIAGSFEIFFVNSLGLPFDSGIIVFLLLFIGVLIYGIYYSQKKKKELLNTALLAFAFILIGYSSYSIILIRSHYDPPIDENDPENVISFVSYLKREQYGSRPLLYGQYFDADVVDQEKGAPVYAKGEKKYEIIDHKIKYVYDPARMTIIPRAYSSSDNHVAQYRSWMNLRPQENPNFADNLVFMFKYQIGYMYMRYFMWNFAGRVSDVQGSSWMTPLDAFKDVPDELANNKGRNNYFMLPLILGLIGMFFNYRKDPKVFGVLLLLFILTGAALVVYLNSPPVEPRERDYIYVGSYYAFAIWIGLGVIAIGQYLLNFIKNSRTSAIVATSVCMIVPLIMAIENWDDHDRSNRYFSVDSARNFLASCAPNAILFTGGDNDTFPLWYAQEVEGFRTDMRVIVLSYFNTDWYINQMTRPAYESAPVPFTLTPEMYRQGGPNDYLPYIENPNLQNQAVNLDSYLDLIRRDHQALKVPTMLGSYNRIPTRTLYLPVNKDEVLSRGLIPDDLQDQVPERMLFSLKGNGLEKNTLMILDMILANNWERPIYFNNTSLMNAGIDFRKYVVQEGNAYRLLPVEKTNVQEEFVNVEVMYENVMNNFYYRELNNPDVYYSEDYRNFVLNHRSTFNTLADALYTRGDTARAKEVLIRSIEVMPHKALPYDHANVQTASLLFEVGEDAMALDIAEKLGTNSMQYLEYYEKYGNAPQNDLQKHMTVLSLLSRMLKNNGQEELSARFESSFMKYYDQLNQ